MVTFEEGLKIINESCGCGKDTVISLATISLMPSSNGEPCPIVRDVDALYEDGSFYITTYAMSTKMLQIEKNPQVAFSIHFQGVSGMGIGENLGWVMEPRNSELRGKLRKTFADWYDAANNEQDKNSVILAIHITKASIFKDHGAVRFQMNFANKSIIE